MAWDRLHSLVLVRLWLLACAVFHCFSALCWPPHVEISAQLRCNLFGHFSRFCPVRTRNNAHPASDLYTLQRLPFIVFLSACVLTGPAACRDIRSYTPRGMMLPMHYVAGFNTRLIMSFRITYGIEVAKCAVAGSGLRSFIPGAFRLPRCTSVLDPSDKILRLM